MKGKLKSVIGNGLPWGIVFFGLSYLLSYYAFNINLKNTLQVSAAMSIAALLMNGFIYSRFTKPLKYLEAIAINLNNSELLLEQAPANLMIQDNLVSGKLFLTDKRIIFKPFEIDEDWLPEYSWNLNEIKPVHFSGSIWNKGGEFILKTDLENSLRFEVDKLKQWKQVFKK